MLRNSTARVLLIAAVASVGIAAPASAIYCQYQGRPTSVNRSSPGFGVVFGRFNLVNSPASCPDNIQAIQFSGTLAANPEPFIGTIETCLDAATLLVLKVNNGRITFAMDDPETGNPGVLIGNSLGPLDSCHIRR